MAKIYISDSYDPYFNLAVETVLFSNPPDERVLYLWRNEDTVVIGRYQNPWRECNIDKMKSDGVHLMRRYTGGGAVFHDTNNICFSFINKKNVGDAAGNDLPGAGCENATGATNSADCLESFKAENSCVICDAVRSLGLEAEISGRNDITVGGYKISGAAYKESGTAFLHHGTILVGTDLTRLATYLQPDERKLQSKGIASVRARVANLRDLANDENDAGESATRAHGDITIEKVCDAVCMAFDAKRTASITHIGKDALEKNPALHAEYEKLRSWEWRFGKSPEFTHRIDVRFAWGGVDIQLNVKEGAVQCVEVFTDSLDTQLADEIKSALGGVAYSTENLCESLIRRAAICNSANSGSAIAATAKSCTATATAGGDATASDDAIASCASPTEAAAANVATATMLCDVAAYISGAFASK